MSDSLTNQRHNDFVGGEASRGRIPGADKATTGHHFIAVDELHGELTRTVSCLNATLITLQAKRDMLTAQRSTCLLQPAVTPRPQAE